MTAPGDEGLHLGHRDAALLPDADARLATGVAVPDWRPASCRGDEFDLIDLADGIDEESGTAADVAEEGPFWH